MIRVFVFDKDEAMRAFLSRRQSMRAVAQEAGVSGYTLQKAILGQPLMSESAAKLAMTLDIAPKWIDAPYKRKGAP